MRDFDAMLPHLHSLLNTLLMMRGRAEINENPASGAALERAIVALRARIAHLEGLPQRDDPPPDAPPERP
jgi:Tfp pilus assembly protein PilN